MRACNAIYDGVYSGHRKDTHRTMYINFLKAGNFDWELLFPRVRERKKKQTPREKPGEKSNIVGASKTTDGGSFLRGFR